MNINLIHSILSYFYFLALDGDYQNDWLSHMPLFWHQIIESIGHFIILIGSLN